MKIAFGTIFLNESQLLPLSIKQHYAFCDKWIFVEGADVRYPRHAVTETGFSTDDSHNVLLSQPDPDKKIQYIAHGWAKSKVELRNRYAERVDDCDILIVVDTDEFLTHKSMNELLKRLRDLPGPGTVRIPHVHFWHGFNKIITGHYWDVPHDRAYRWCPGARYKRDHNHPELGGSLLRDFHTLDVSRIPLAREDGSVALGAPHWLHFANCKQPEMVADKNAYYVARGEGRTRPRTVMSREAFFQPNEELPEGLKVWDWTGDMPEAIIEWLKTQD